jgi:hypothetical protein
MQTPKKRIYTSAIRWMQPFLCPVLWRKTGVIKTWVVLFGVFLLDKPCGMALHGAVYVRCLMNILRASNSAFRAHPAGGLEF